MKKIFTLYLITVGFFVCGQSLTPTVVATSGDFFSGSTASLSWTLGEVVTDTYIGTNNQLTQGFQQPDRSFLTIEDFSPEIETVLFPNPTTTFVNLQVKNSSENLLLKIYDELGNLVISDLYITESTHQLNLEILSNGVYFLEVQTLNFEKVEIIKIQKL